MINCQSCNYSALTQVGWWICLTTGDIVDVTSINSGRGCKYHSHYKEEDDEEPPTGHA